MLLAETQVPFQILNRVNGIKRTKIVHCPSLKYSWAVPPTEWFICRVLKHESAGFHSGTADIWKDCRACKMSVITCPMTQCHNPEDLNLQQYFDLLQCSQMDVCIVLPNM